MNKPYEITTHEFWALAALTAIPIQSGSIITQWLNDYEAPQSNDVLQEAHQALLKKGYIDPRRNDGAIPDELLEALFVLALSSVTLTASISRGGERVWTTFGQLDESVVEYRIDENRLLVHPPAGMEETAAILAPDWFVPQVKGKFSGKLPFGALLILVAALQLEEKQSLLAEDGVTPAFQHSDLVGALKEMGDWVDFYSEVGIPGFTQLDQFPVEEHIALLTKNSYIQPAGDGLLHLGPQAAVLAEAYGDPDLCSNSLSITGTTEGFPPTGSLLYGSGILLLLQLTGEGTFILRQLNVLEEAVSWASSLLAKGAAVQPQLPDMGDELVESIPSETMGADAESIPETHGEEQLQPAEKPKNKRKRWLTCAIILGALVLIVVCVLLAMYIYDEIMWTPSAVGMLRGI